MISRFHQAFDRPHLRALYNSLVNDQNIHLFFSVELDKPRKYSPPSYLKNLNLSFSLLASHTSPRMTALPPVISACLYSLAISGTNDLTLSHIR